MEHDEETEFCCKGVVRVDYIGEQDDGQGGAFALYNLLDNMGEYPVGSTLAANTIWKQGYAYIVTNEYNNEEDIP